MNPSTTLIFKLPSVGSFQDGLKTLGHLLHPRSCSNPESSRCHRGRGKNLFHPPWAMWQSRPRLRDHRGVSHLPQVASLPALPVPPTVPQSAGVVSVWGAWDERIKVHRSAERETSRLIRAYLPWFPENLEIGSLLR